MAFLVCERLPLRRRPVWRLKTQPGVFEWKDGSGA